MFTFFFGPSSIQGEWKIHMHKILRASRNSIPYVCICWIAFVPTLLAVFTYIFSTGVVITGPQATFIKASYNLVMGCFQVLISILSLIETKQEEDSYFLSLLPIFFSMIKSLWRQILFSLSWSCRCFYLTSCECSVPKVFTFFLLPLFSKFRITIQVGSSL